MTAPAGLVEATRGYEQWMARQIPVVRPDLIKKHRVMAESAFVFLRGTFYRWIQLWPTICRSLRDAPVVAGVGDLHVENFGTWRDLEGRLVWGINDVDEACVVPYTQDLVRLATSAVLATRHGAFGLTHRETCETILEGYRQSLERGGSPFVLAERRRWLRQIALNKLRDPTRFWGKFDGLPPAATPVPRGLLRTALPDPRLSYRIFRRVAGVGSLGRPRIVALALWHGALTAREAKAILPSAAVWHVNAAATGSNTGQNWSNAYTDLQSALSAAQSGDQIWVAQGMYVPTRRSNPSPSERAERSPRWRICISGSVLLAFVLI